MVASSSRNGWRSTLSPATKVRFGFPVVRRELKSYELYHVVSMIPTKDWETRKDLSSVSKPHHSSMLGFIGGILTGLGHARSPKHLKTHLIHSHVRNKTGRQNLAPRFPARMR